MAENTVVRENDKADGATPEVTRGGTLFTPRVDIYETEQELLLFADLPGVRPEDVDLRFENGELFLHGRVQPKERGGNVLATEYDEGNFSRVFTIHESIDASGITAECKSGVLTVHLPKVEAVKPRQIAVRG